MTQRPFKTLVKILKYETIKAKKQFLVEALMIPHLKHDNIINLMGCCIEGYCRFLVYEYIPSNSLAKQLSDNGEFLDWDVRMVIAHGVVEALNYLHNKAPDFPIFFTDLKPENILLDAMEKGFHPKLSDFGSAIYGPDYKGDHAEFFSNVEPSATVGYSAPEQATNCTAKCDVYSFGVVLLKLFIGKSFQSAELKNFRALNEPDLLSQADPKLNSEFPEDTFLEVIEMALKCTEVNPKSWPRMAEIVGVLKEFQTQKYNLLKDAAD